MRGDGLVVGGQEGLGGSQPENGETGAGQIQVEPLLSQANSTAWPGRGAGSTGTARPVSVWPAAALDAGGSRGQAVHAVAAVQVRVIGAGFFGAKLGEDDVEPAVGQGLRD